MKRIKTALAILMVLGLVVALCACGSQPAPEGESAAGEYTLFAVETYGYTVDPAALEMTSVLTLDADGTGYLTLDDDGGDISEWTVDGENISVTSGVDTMVGTIHDGIVILDFDYGNILYYAAPGADTSGVSVMNGDDFLAAVMADVEAGVIELD
ncbi:MAG: hypothetical protein IKD96_02790 [Oscillospiraceae bacterium]|nr:hypothetical protein [Oscillospiraceae bacterium]